MSIVTRSDREPPSRLEKWGHRHREVLAPYDRTSASGTTMITIGDLNKRERWVEDPCVAVPDPPPNASTLERLCRWSCRAASQ